MHKILLIDDDINIRETISAFLQMQDYDIHLAESAKKAYELINYNDYACILVDFFLPDKDGTQFIEELHQKDIHIPFILITGSSDVKIARKAVQLGFYDYLVKPFKNRQLQQVVKNAILQKELIDKQENLEREKQNYQQELELLVEKKTAELKESEEKFEKLLNQSLVGIYILQNNVIRYANDKFCEIFNISNDELIDKRNLLDFVADGNKKLVEKKIKRLERNKYNSETFQFESPIGDGKKKIIETWASVVKYQGKNATEGVVIDVTEQVMSKTRERVLEIELLNEQKLAAIGQVAAGITHNLNNPIAVIQGLVELLVLKHGNSTELEKILIQVKRMGDVIKSILGKTRKEQDTKIRNLDLNVMLSEELEFFKTNLFYKHHIEKKIMLADKLPKIKGIYSDFSQSFTNIIQNAIDAMFDTTKRELTVETKSDSSYIYINIGDSGCGIDPDIKNKVFEPFFTTKPLRPAYLRSGNSPFGTGLGLSSTYQLLHSYGVEILFESEKGKGTVFTLKIPLKNN
jgi:PAS domain S-box-containing protein